MAKSTSLLASVPDGYGIVFNRLIILALSTATLAVYAATYSIFNARIASTGGLAPSHSSPLTANGLSLVPSAISIVWSVTHLSLLARRLVRSHRRNSRSHEGTDSKAVVHPIWPLLADCTCFVLFVVAAVLTGVKVTKWRNGRVDYGSEGTRQVDLHACPTFDPATGKLDYWCGQAWNQVVNLTNSGTSIMGTLAYVSVHLISSPLLSPFHIRHTSTGWLILTLFFQRVAASTSSAYSTHAMTCTYFTATIAREALMPSIVLMTRPPIAIHTKQRRLSWSGNRQVQIHWMDRYLTGE